ncbi:hypothetical protein M513_12591 [Trichuris suis]|uniref:Uncharacterized protein n=1 Tax=Trichuris suis TaxID=68888 RepID=A0A085LNJ4_9BILA|nr:hypothetical protein M513_12591 [Trichuris suis]
MRSCVIQVDGRALRFVPDGRLTLALSVTVDTITIAELDVLISPPLKRRAIPLRFVLNTCAGQVELCLYSGGWNREIESTLRGVGSDLRPLLVTGGTMKTSTYVGQ